MPPNGPDEWRARSRSLGEQKAAVVPDTLWVSPTRPATSTSGQGDLGSTSVVRFAATLTGLEGGHWHV